MSRPMSILMNRLTPDGYKEFMSVLTRPEFFEAVHRLVGLQNLGLTEDILEEVLLLLTILPAEPVVDKSRVALVTWSPPEKRQHIFTFEAIQPIDSSTKSQLMVEKSIKEICSGAVNKPREGREDALLVLAKCLTNKNRIMQNVMRNMNPRGEESLLSVASCNATHEHSVVRKAAIKLLKQLVLYPYTMPSQKKQAISTLVHLCRDETMHVRIAVFTALGELLMTHPSTITMHAFLKGPLARFFDPVYEIHGNMLVADFVKKLIFDRLKKYTEAPVPAPDPWMIIKEVVALDKHRQFDQTCAEIEMTCPISRDVLTILESHLGVKDEEHDMLCLIMLVSFTANLKSSEQVEVRFVITFYHKTAADEKNLESGVMELILMLLKNVARYLPDEDRSNLRNHLLLRLSSLEVDNTTKTVSSVIMLRVLASCCDVIAVNWNKLELRPLVANVAKALAPNDLIWASEMIRNSETRALMGHDVASALRVSDLVEVPREQPSVAIYNYLVNIALNEPTDMDEVRRCMYLTALKQVCLRDLRMSQRVTPMLVKTLNQTTESITIRLLILTGLGEIGLRNGLEPSLMEAYYDCFAKSNPQVLRREAVRQLTKYLDDDEMDLLPPMYYRYGALTVDQDVEVRKMSKAYIMGNLPIDTVPDEIVPAIFYYNQVNGKIRDSLTARQRQTVYDLLIKRLRVEHKPTVIYALSEKVLRVAAEFASKRADHRLSPPLMGAMLDAITLLWNPTLKLPTIIDKYLPLSRFEGIDLETIQEELFFNIMGNSMIKKIKETILPEVTRLYKLMPRGGRAFTAIVKLTNYLCEEYLDEVIEELVMAPSLMQALKRYRMQIGAPPLDTNSVHSYWMDIEPADGASSGPQRSGSAYAPIIATAHASTSQASTPLASPPQASAPQASTPQATTP